MKKLIKRFLRKLMGWYVEPLYRQNEELGLRLAAASEALGRLENELANELKNELTNKISNLRDSDNKLSAKIADTSDRLENYRTELGQRVSDIEGRENWVRERFEEIYGRVSDIEEREEWTRQRFERLGKKLKTMQMLNSGGQTADGEYATPSFAQAGEDAIIAYILNFLQREIEDVTYLDIGANHAKELSNTYCFYQAGAHGVLVEANPELIPELKQERPRDVVLNRIMDLADDEERDFYVISGDGLSTVSREEAEAVCTKNPELFIKAQYKAGTCTVERILDEYFPEPPTILSIDIEGMEERILSGIDYAKSSPLVIILENIPYSPLLSIDRRDYKCVEFLREKGYTEYAFTGINSIFLLTAVVEEFNKRRRQELAGDRR